MFFKLLGASSIVLLSIVSGAHIAPNSAWAQDFQNTQNRKSYANQKLHITIQNEENISGIYTVNEQNQITLPLIGSVQVEGQSLSKIETLLTTRFKEGYLINPIISVTRIEPEKSLQPNGTTIRPKAILPAIYILGSVKNPGRYELPSDATHILNIIALAGGFTGNAKTKNFEIVRKNQKIEFDKETYQPLGGDIVIVKNRYFWAGNR